MAKVALLSLGCAKNQVDAEVMLSDLAAAGHEIVERAEAADVAVVNTCGFIEDARREAIDAILDMCDIKAEGSLRGIIATGCMAERYEAEMKKELPELDAVLGVGSFGRIAQAVDAVMRGEYYESFEPKELAPMGGARTLISPPYTAYLKIAEGCDNRCAYCAIPGIKGPYRSRDLPGLLDEAKTLAEGGVRELSVIAQDTTRYGDDLPARPTLPDLLRGLERVDGLKWIRLLYCYPDRVDDALLDVMAKSDKIVPYIDLPLQHASDSVLRAMNRRGDERFLDGLIGRIRRAVPGITLRTTFMVGFPGESEDDFERLCAFAERHRFERAGIFIFSPEEGTPAADMDAQVPLEAAQRRQERLMAIQADIAEELSADMVESTLEVLCEGYDTVTKLFYGRSAADAPEVDPKVFFKSKHVVKPGEFARVKITDAMEFDLLGETT